MLGGDRMDMVICFTVQLVVPLYHYHHYLHHVVHVCVWAPWQPINCQGPTQELESHPGPILPVVNILTLF